MSTVVEIQSGECDACSYEAHSKAYLFATHPHWPAGLAFCSHHGTKFLPQLREDRAAIIDQRFLLTEAVHR